jgi:hypothetical protein
MLFFSLRSLNIYKQKKLYLLSHENLITQQKQLSMFTKDTDQHVFSPQSILRSISNIHVYFA